MSSASTIALIALAAVSLAAACASQQSGASGPFTLATPQASNGSCENLLIELPVAVDADAENAAKEARSQQPNLEQRLKDAERIAATAKDAQAAAQELAGAAAAEKTAADKELADARAAFEAAFLARPPVTLAKERVSLATNEKAWADDVLGAWVKEFKQAAAARKAAGASDKSKAEQRERDAKSKLAEATKAANAAKLAVTEAEQLLKQAQAAEKKLDAATLRAHIKADLDLAVANARLAEAQRGGLNAASAKTEGDKALRLAKFEAAAAARELELLKPGVEQARVALAAEAKSPPKPPQLCVKSAGDDLARLRLRQLKGFQCVRVRTPDVEALGFAGAGDRADRDAITLRVSGESVEFLLRGGEVTSETAGAALGEALTFDELDLDLFEAPCEQICQDARPGVSLRFEKGHPKPYLERISPEAVTCQVMKMRAGKRDATGGSGNSEAASAGSSSGGSGTSNGGSGGAGGSAATGGGVSSGGSVGTGGSANTAGSVGTGGSAGTGGTASTGGSAGTGGQP